jgi:hypothetical protein
MLVQKANFWLMCQVDSVSSHPNPQIKKKGRKKRKEREETEAKLHENQKQREAWLL